MVLFGWIESFILEWLFLPNNLGVALMESGILICGLSAFGGLRRRSVRERGGRALPGDVCMSDSV